MLHAGDYNITCTHSGDMACIRLFTAKVWDARAVQVTGIQPGAVSKLSTFTGIFVTMIINNLLGSICGGRCLAFSASEIGRDVAMRCTLRPVNTSHCICGRFSDLLIDLVGINDTLCVTQAYDGAASLCGIYNGTLAFIKSQCPPAVSMCIVVHTALTLFWASHWTCLKSKRLSLDFRVHVSAYWWLHLVPGGARAYPAKSSPKITNPI